MRWGTKGETMPGSRRRLLGGVDGNECGSEGPLALDIYFVLPLRDVAEEGDVRLRQVLVRVVI